MLNSSKVPAAMVVRLVGGFAIAGALVMSPDEARANDYPNRTVTIVVPFAPGGPNDVLARVLAEQLSGDWGVNVIVDNRPGGGTVIGSQAVAASAADGYTLLMASTSTASNVTLRQLPYDTQAAFVPVVLMGTAPTALAVHPDLPIESVSDLIAYAQANPGTTLAGTGGVGSSTDLKSHLLVQEAGIDSTVIPYEGGGPARTDLIGGRLTWAFLNLLSAVPDIEAGLIRAIGVTGAEESPSMPGVPPISDTIPDFEAYNWWGMFAPAGTPEDVVAQINAAVNAVVEREEMVTFMSNLGTTPVTMSAEDFAQFFESQVTLWAGVIERAGIAEQ